MNTQDIADRLVVLCRQADWSAAQKELYAEDAVSIEPEATPIFPKETRGLDALIEKGRKFDSLVETMHSLSVSDPLVAASSFACTLQMDMTIKGQGRMNVTELCVYNVRDGKIASEQFHM